MAKVLIVGASGLLGRPLAKALLNSGHQVVTHGLTNAAACDFSVDLTEVEDSMAMLNATKPDIIVNLAALTNVDYCEADPARAYALNVKPVEIMANWVRLHEATHLIQISTDQVYNGQGPHDEGDVNIINIYGLSKYAGELVALGVGGTVLRTNFFGSSEVAGRLSFSDWLIGKLVEGSAFTTFEDVLFSPLSMPSLCAAIIRVCDRRIRGTFNLGSRDGMSKAAFAMRLAKNLNLDPSPMQVGPLSTVALKARRPHDMRMNCALFEKTFDYLLPNLAAEIDRLEYPDAST